LKNLKAIIFDLDDTLYLEKDFVSSGFKAVSAWLYNHRGLDQGKVFTFLDDEFKNGDSGKVFDSFLREHHGLGLDVADLVTLYRDHKPQILPLSGVPRLLECLHLTKKIGLISDGYLSVQKNKYEALGLNSFFDEIIFSDSLGREYWKPSNKPYDIILNRLNVDPVEAVYIGDNPQKDFLYPNKIGMKTIRFNHDQGVYTKVQCDDIKNIPTTTVHSITELRAILSCEK